MASNTGHVMNLSNSIIGVSLLAMPFCFKQCGITLAIVMLILSSIVSRLACYFLVKSSTVCRRRNFEFLAFYTFGPSGKLLVELGVIGFMMGTCVAFFVVMGDLGPAIISKIFHINNNTTLRSSVLIGLGLLVVLPLGLLRNVESLAAISTVTIGYYFLFILKIFFESSPHLVSGDWWSHVRFWKPEGVLQCIPIFAMALSCQTQIFEIYNSLPSPSVEKMNSVVRSALNLCTVVYASVGVLGYIAYYQNNFTGNIMLSFTPSLSSEVFKLGFVMSVAVSFPLVIFPCRASLFSLIFKKMPIHQELSQTSSHIPDSRFKCLTVVIVSVALITGLLIPSIELVLGFVGSTIGIAICVIFPAVSFLSLCNKNTNERAVAKMTFLLGLIIMIMGTFGNLFAAVEHKSLQSPSGKFGDSKNLPQLKVPVKTESSTETVRKHINKDVAIVHPVLPEELAPQREPERLKSRIKIAENIRKEPPVPVAPLLGVPGEKDKKNEEKLEKIDKVDTKIKKETKAKLETEHQKSKQDLSKTKDVEKINKDAIEKENREIMDVEKQKKAEEDQKQQELFKRLKEHQDEQKKLLQEQEKILKEIKSRENEKKLKEKSKESKFLLEEVKTIKPDEFKADLNKIQSVIDNLKGNKNIIEKLKDKDKVVETQNSNPLSETSKGAQTQRLELEKIQKKDPKDTEIKSPVASVPLPLAKLRSQPEQKEVQAQEKEQPLKSKQEVLARDILVEKAAEREKRDADAGGGECVNKNKMEQKTDRKTENLILEISNRSLALIKNSALLSVDLSDKNKPEMTDAETSKLISDFQNQPFMSKKRDLKSISTVSS